MAYPDPVLNLPPFGHIGLEPPFRSNGQCSHCGLSGYEHTVYALSSPSFEVRLCWQCIVKMNRALDNDWRE